MTHWAITQIDPFFDALTLDDANELIEAGLTNSQIRWIASDEDVSNFYARLIDAFSGQIKDGLEEQAKAAFQPGILVEVGQGDDSSF